MAKTNWFKKAIIYQIYPRSFKDGDNDGFGDIRGIISKLDYLKELGINCIWFSPLYDSPQADNGYDISDYKNIYPKFGNIFDFQTLLKAMHDRGIKCIMDLVVNHTSDEHRWFKEACKSKDNPYHDYYIWRDGKGKKKHKAPTNWMSLFGGKAWEYVPSVDQYYLHLFDKKQPDLNWENPKVREEVKSVLKFWLDMGVDGFRCDVINLISKAEIKDGKELLIKGSGQYVNGPKLHEYLQELNKDVLSKYDCATVGETVFTTLDDAKNLTAPDRRELDMIFNFDHISCDCFFGVKYFKKKFKLVNLKKAFDKWQYGNKNGWNTLFLENHDQRRCVGRFGTSDGKYREASAKMLATMCFFQRGTPFIYQGQEIGMTNYPFQSFQDFKDTEAKIMYKTLRKLGLTNKTIFESMKQVSRDNARTPMQWDGTTYAGFSNVEPWISVNPNKNIINVRNCVYDANSILYYFKKLIAIHKQEDELLNARYIDLLPKDKNLYVYRRVGDNNDYLCINNFSSKAIEYSIPSELKGEKILLLNNYPVDSPYNAFILKPFETRLYKFVKK